MSGSSWFTSLSDHDRLLQTSNWFQGSYLEYTKGTGNFNKYRRGIRDGYLKIMNITYAEAGTYECEVETAVSKIFGHSRDELYKNRFSRKIDSRETILKSIGLRKDLFSL